MSAAARRTKVGEQAFLRGAKRRLPLSRFGVIALGTLAVIALATLVGPLLWPWDPLAQHFDLRLQNPSLAHPFGTDQYGRDLLARALAGGRWSLGGALVVCLGTNLVGLVVGALAASGRTLLDLCLSRLMEAIMALPNILTALAVASLLGPSFTNLLLALVVSNWPWYARAYRNLILKERSAGYIEGAIAVGSSWRRQLLCHILPNIVGPIVVVATTNIGAVILSLSALSFLGLGMQPPTPEWGAMINEARGFFQTYPWQMIAPGLCIALCVLAINVAGDALRDAIDPFTRGLD